MIRQWLLHDLVMSLLDVFMLLRCFLYDFDVLLGEFACCFFMILGIVLYILIDLFMMLRDIFFIL